MKKILKALIIGVVTLSSSGCLKKDTMENINIYTTAYPSEYITNRLYGNYSTINSIYPDGVNINEYKLTNKQITDYSQSDLLIYNGESSEKDYAVKMINKNNNMKIIDISQGIDINYGINTLWLDPSNFLMLTQNIRNGFKEYITNFYLKKEIDTNYDDLKVDISELDAELKLIAANSDGKTIVALGSTLKYLEKYNFNVITIDENDSLIAKNINDINKLANEKKIKYIYVFENEVYNNSMNKILQTYPNLKVLVLNDLSNISTNARNEKKDYLSIMKDNIDLIKKAIYE